MGKATKGEGGFTLIELLVVVAIIGILAGIIAYSVTRFLGSGESEAVDTEFQTITTAVFSMMVDNDITTIPNPVSANTAPCTTGTRAMDAYPDTTSDETGGDNGEKSKDPNFNDYDNNDKAGYLLYTHDIVADSSATSTVNYVATSGTAYCYAVASDGSVTQYETEGAQTNP